MFSKKTNIGLLTIMLLSSWACSSTSQTGPTGPAITHELPKLAYSYYALEPVIDTKTMEIHYSRHHKAYVDNLNKAIEGTAMASMPLETLMAQKNLSPAVRNNGGGHYNHTLFWSIIAPTTTKSAMSAELQKAIEATFGSVDAFKAEFEKAGTTRFGSGWAWLVVKADGSLAVSSTANQDNPLMLTSEVRGTPILGNDVWEHAYYLKYQNKRADYLKEWWKIVNWTEVSKRYSVATAK